MENFISNLVNKKAEENNQFCLTAYYKGIEDSSAVEMLEMLIKLKPFISELVRVNGVCIEEYAELDNLIKKVTTI